MLTPYGGVLNAHPPQVALRRPTLFIPEQDTPSTCHQSRVPIVFALEFMSWSRNNNELLLTTMRDFEYEMEVHKLDKQVTLIVNSVTAYFVASFV
jgi:hypothetical protein